MCGVIGQLVNCCGRLCVVSVVSWYIVLVGCVWFSGQLVHCLGRLCVVSVVNWYIVLVGCVWCQWSVGTLSW